MCIFVLFNFHCKCEINIIQQKLLHNHFVLLPDYCTQAYGCTQTKKRNDKNHDLTLRDQSYSVSITLPFAEKHILYTHSVWNDLYNKYSYLLPVSLFKLQQCQKNVYVNTQDTCEGGGGKTLGQKLIHTHTHRKQQ